MIHRILLVPLLGAVLGACASGGAAPGEPAMVGPTAQETERLPARFEVLGRGPVTHTRTTDLYAFRGVDGRDYVYMGTWGGCQGCVGNRLYVWDVTDPARPALTDSVVVDAQSILDVAVNEARTLAAFGRRGAESRRNGVVLLDLANQPIGRWGVPDSPERFLSSLAVQDGLAYLAYWDDGLVILDVGKGIKGGTPRRPQLVSQTRYRTEWRNRTFGNTHYAVPYTNRAGRRYVFVADQILPLGTDLNRRQEIGGELHVFDATNPAMPVAVASYDAPTYGISRFWVHNDTLYTGTNNGGLRALDVSGDLRGRIRGRELAVLATGDPQGFVPNLTFTWAAMPHNGMVFATDFNSGLWVTRLVPGPR